MKDNRFYLARTKHSQHGFQSADVVSNATSVSSSAIDSLESENPRNVSFKTVRTLAQYYNVSSDYLLGLSEEPTTNENLKTAVKTTGLSKAAIDNIRDCDPFVAALSLLLEDSELPKLLVDIMDFMNNLYVLDKEIKKVKSCATEEQLSMKELDRFSALYADVVILKMDIMDTFKELFNRVIPSDSTLRDGKTIYNKIISGEI